jgi:hypothetical protein
MEADRKADIDMEADMDMDMVMEADMGVPDMDAGCCLGPEENGVSLGEGVEG